MKAPKLGRSKASKKRLSNPRNKLDPTKRERAPKAEMNQDEIMFRRSRRGFKRGS